jgi:xanthine dehydrogenase YagR molybdenum-binding subunit
MRTDEALRMPGVLAIHSPFNAPRLPKGWRESLHPPAGRILSLLQDDRVAYNGQPIGVVVAGSLEAAQAAARLIRIDYETSEALLAFDRAKDSLVTPEKVNDQPPDTHRGDLPGAMAGASARVGAVYTTPIEHHNPMEPHATIAAWDGDVLTLYDSTQYVSGVKSIVAKILGIAPHDVTVVSPFVGGGFGCKGSTWSHVVLAAMAARQVGRPVKLVLERPQMFAGVGNRPHTEQRIAIGADASGTFRGMQHDVISETSMLENWTEPSALVTRMLYACGNQATSHRLAKLNISTPTFTRAPGEASGNFALECAIDELAAQLDMDPLALRLRNYAASDPNKNKPFSSKSLRACYALGAERFGWSRRSARPASVRQGHWLTGMGMATACYPTNRSAASATATLLPDGGAVVECGTQDLGTGTYTVMTQVASDALGIAPERIRFILGDSRLPPAPVSGGSQSAASVSPAVQAACTAARLKLAQIAVNDPLGPLYRQSADSVRTSDGWIHLQGSSDRGEAIATLLSRNGGNGISARGEGSPGKEKEAYSMHAFGAVFAEVWVDADLGTVRVPRICGAYAVGNVLNAKTARSQLMGGIVWGVSMALFEESHRDGRTGRVVNANLAEYHVPVNADIGTIDVAFVAESDDHVNPLGVKGIGEIGITGVPAAIGNAVYNATGKRIRDLPIRLDKLI